VGRSRAAGGRSVGEKHGPWFHEKKDRHFSADTGGTHGSECGGGKRRREAGGWAVGGWPTPDSRLCRRRSALSHKQIGSAAERLVWVAAAIATVSVLRRRRCGAAGVGWTRLPVGVGGEGNGGCGDRPPPQRCQRGRNGRLGWTMAAQRRRHRVHMQRQYGRACVHGPHARRHAAGLCK